VAFGEENRHQNVPLNPVPNTVIVVPEAGLEVGEAWVTAGWTISSVFLEPRDWTGHHDTGPLFQPLGFDDVSSVTTTRPNT
jgi:hypothetical protein